VFDYDGDGKLDYLLGVCRLFHEPDLRVSNRTVERERRGADSRFIAFQGVLKPMPSHVYRNLRGSFTDSARVRDFCPWGPAWAWCG